MVIHTVKVEFYDDSKKNPLKHGIITLHGDKATLLIVDYGIKLCDKEITNKTLVKKAIDILATYYDKKPIPEINLDNDVGFSIIYNDDEKSERFLDASFKHQNMMDARDALIALFPSELSGFDVMVK